MYFCKATPRQKDQLRSLYCMATVFFGICTGMPLMSAQLTQRSLPKTADDYYEQGLLHYQKRDWEGAIAAFTQAIQINPGDRDAYYRRGFAHCKLEEAQASNLDFSHSSALHPPAYCMNGVLRVDSSGMGFQLDPGELERKGYELLQNGDIEQAAQALQKASTIFRAQGKILRYRKVQQALGKLMRP